MVSSRTPPAFLLPLLRPLHPPNSDFTLVRSKISVSTSPTQYLYKASPLPATQLIGEAESLDRAQEAREGVAPKLLGWGGTNDGESRWMLSVWQDLRSLSSDVDFEQLATLIAAQHTSRPPAPWDQQFGFPVTTCCGRTELDNRPLQGDSRGNWAHFYAERRVGNLLVRIGDPELERVGRKVIESVIPRLLGCLKITPSLLHGDLWSGNVGFSNTTSSAITFDPASYYGHSEAEFGITRMFGGFPPSFFEAYHRLVPISEPVSEYEIRGKLYECWHRLNHTLLFGMSYRGGALRLLNELVDWVETSGA